MALFTYRGLIAPVFTAFNIDMSPNLEIIPKYAEYLFKNGVKGILVNGTTGEGMSMTVSERKLVAEAWSTAATLWGMHLMVQVGGCCLSDVMDLARHAETINADSLLCLPDLYYKPATTEELIEYLTAVADTVPHTPLFYYHIPSFTSVNIHMGDLLNKIGNRIPNFHGVKFTSTALDEGVACLKAFGAEFSVFLGADQIMAAAYTMGFDSAIATTINIFPALNAVILESMKDLRLDDARDAQHILNDMISAITKNGKWVPTMKAAMNVMSHIDLGPVRPPLKDLTIGQIQEMKNDLKELQK